MRKNVNQTASLKSSSICFEKPTDKVTETFPFSYVFNRNAQCPVIENLTKDFRRMLEPYTARKQWDVYRNGGTIIDKASVHYHLARMFVFNKNENETTMQIGRLPNGPTLSFNVDEFKLAIELHDSYCSDDAYKGIFRTSAFVILNNFNDKESHMKSVFSTFQNMFPTFSCTVSSPSSSFSRCVVISYDSIADRFHISHYSFTKEPTKCATKKNYFAKLPAIPNCDEITDFIEKMYEDVDSDCTPNSLNINLKEIGPRLVIRLVKIEDRLLYGRMSYNRYMRREKKEVNDEHFTSDESDNDEDYNEYLLRGNQRLRKQFVPKYTTRDKPEYSKTPKKSSNKETVNLAKLKETRISKL